MPLHPKDTHDFTADELDIMDELYFIKPYSQLLKEVQLDVKALNKGLWQLIKVGYVRTASLQDGQAHHLPTTDNELAACNLLATKEGLLALHTA